MNLPKLDTTGAESPESTISAMLARRPAGSAEPAGEGAALRKAIDNIGSIGELTKAAPQGQGKELDDVIDLLVWQTRVLLMNEAIAGGRLVAQPGREPKASASDPSKRV